VPHRKRIVVYVQASTFAAQRSAVASQRAASASSPAERATSAPHTRPAISAAIVAGEYPAAFSQRSLSVAGPLAATKFAARRIPAHSERSLRPTKPVDVRPNGIVARSALATPRRGPRARTSGRSMVG
jgi:hypothetical protein